MIPLTEMKGSEKLPRKKDYHTIDYLSQNPIPRIEGHNTAVEKMQQCGIVVNVEKLQDTLYELYAGEPISEAKEYRKGVIFSKYNIILISQSLAAAIVKHIKERLS